MGDRKDRFLVATVAHNAAVADSDGAVLSSGRSEGGLDEGARSQRLPLRVFPDLRSPALS
jgi:hypothetical protein